MGQHVSRTDFEWTYTEEPHATRRKIILAKYPQIKKLFGCDPNLKWIVTSMVLVQFAMLFVMKDRSWGVTLLVAYCFGGVLNNSLMLAIHDVSHNVAFGNSRPLANRLFSIFANLPLGLPASISFKKYHIVHHKYLADVDIDPDIPTYLEAKLFCTTLGKIIWVILQPFFYALRPMMYRPQPTKILEYVNFVTQMSCNIFVWIYFGSRVYFYLLLGTLLCMGLHPIGGHFIAEHYMFKKGFETYSYYGPWNKIMFNAGYHNEHHDFPAVPGSRLPEVKKIAAEFYDNLPQHHSWTGVLYDFIMDPDVGPYARVVRKNKGLST